LHRYIFTAAGSIEKLKFFCCISAVQQVYQEKCI